MSLQGPNLGLNHAYAAERHYDFIIEAERDRLLRHAERSRPARRAGIAHALGGALIRCGAWLQRSSGSHPFEDAVPCAISRAVQ